MISVYFYRVLSVLFSFKPIVVLFPKPGSVSVTNILTSLQEYTLNTIKGSFAYVWKESITKEHALEVLRVNLVNPSYIDPEYQKQLDTNIVLARSLEKTFIIGPTYNFNFNSNLRPNRNKNNFYFNGNIDLSANLAGIISGANVEKTGVQKHFSMFLIPNIYAVK